MEEPQPDQNNNLATDPLHTRARRRRGTGTGIASLHSTRGAASIAVVGIAVVAGLSPSLGAVTARGWWVVLVVEANADTCEHSPLLLCNKTYVERVGLLHCI